MIVLRGADRRGGDLEVLRGDLNVLGGERRRSGILSGDRLGDPRSRGKGDRDRLGGGDRERRLFRALGDKDLGWKRGGVLDRDLGLVRRGDLERDLGRLRGGVRERDLGRMRGGERDLDRACTGDLDLDLLGRAPRGGGNIYVCARPGLSLSAAQCSEFQSKMGLQFSEPKSGPMGGGPSVSRLMVNPLGS